MKVFYTKENKYDSCKVIDHEDSPDYRVLKCQNYMNEIDQHFIYNNQFAMCKYHYCAIVYDVSDLTHSILTCSGAIFRFDTTKFFNPLNVYVPDFEEIKALPKDTFENTFEKYYLKDSRTSFSQDIDSVNCTNNYKTCLTFDDGNSVCIGSVDDIFVLDSFPSFIIGVMTAILFSTFVYLTLRRFVRYFRNIVIIVMYFVPLLSIALIFNSVLVLSYLPYVLGNLVVMFSIPLMSSYTDELFDKYIKI